VSSLERAFSLTKVDELSLFPGDIWTSTCRGLIRCFSRYNSETAEGSLASEAARSKDLRKLVRCLDNTHASPSSSKGGLDQYGKAHRRASSFASSAVNSCRFDPGIVGRRPRSAVSLDANCSRPRQDLASGPMKTSPASSHSRANWGLSARNHTGMNGFGFGAFRYFDYLLGC